MEVVVSHAAAAAVPPEALATVTVPPRTATAAMIAKTVARMTLISITLPCYRAMRFGIVDPDYGG